MFYIEGSELTLAAASARALITLALRVMPAGAGVDDVVLIQPGDLMEMSRLRGILEERLLHHIFPPAALGAKRSSLAHKLHTVVHSMRLEPCSWSDTSRLAQHFVSMTTDMGSELELPQLKPIAVADFFPYWVRLPLDADDGIDDLENVGDPLDEASTVTFKSGLVIPGMMHIVDNVTKGVLAALEVWDEVKPCFQDMATWWHYPHNRDLVKARIVPAPQHFLLDTGPPLFEGGRVWGVLSAILDWLLPREVCLRRNWSLRDLLRELPDAGADADGDAAGEAPREDRYQSVSKLARKVDTHMDSQFVWSCMHMLASLDETCLAISCWCMSCPCHRQETLKLIKQRMRSQFPDAHDETSRCPLAGLRAPEVACGGLDRLVSQVADLEVGNFVHYHCGGLPQASRDRLVDSFERGKQIIELQLRFKLSAWKMLPLRVLGLGHFDLQKARRCMLRCLMQFSAATDEERAVMHDTTVCLLQGLRRDLVRFIRGGDLSPALQRFADAFTFVPILETSVERLHAMVAQRVRIAHNHSPYYVSLSLRRSEILAFHAHNAAELADQCSRSQSQVAAVQAFGLQWHPSFEPYRLHEPRGPRREMLDKCLPFSLAASVIYRCDLKTQFRALPAVEFFFDDDGMGGGDGDEGDRRRYRFFQTQECYFYHCSSPNSALRFSIF